jgi:predicted P-loop ATPase/GTPase
MGIRSISEYVQFYIGLNMQNSISLSSFVYNEKLVMTNKLEKSSLKKEQIVQGLQILDELLSEIRNNGEKAVIEKYVK